MPDPTVPPPLSPRASQLVEAVTSPHTYAPDDWRTRVAALRSYLGELEARPCPHVITSGTTSHCGLAASDAAADLAQIRRLSALLREAGDVLNDNAHWDNRAGGLVERIQSAVGGGL